MRLAAAGLLLAAILQCGWPSRPTQKASRTSHAVLSRTAHLAPRTAHPAPRTAHLDASASQDAFASMTDAERAFAQAAKERGVRAAFLEFLDDEAIGFEPSLGRAKDAWRARPVPADPLATTLSWLPRAGDVSAGGDLGWLTGPYVLVPNGDVSHTAYGCYFSIWIRREGAPWRVLIDAGVSTQEPCAFAGEGVARLAYDEAAENATAAAARSSLLAQDRALDTLAASAGLADAVGPRLHPGARINREGMQPLLGPANIVEFLRTRPGSWTLVQRGGDVASSGDLGYTYGEYDRKENIRTTEAGYYVRVWRRVGADWRVTFDTLVPES
jgi:hypothetical protein